MVNFKRCLKHAFFPPKCWRKFFTKETLKAIETAVSQSETHHSGELRFAIENALHFKKVWRGITAQQRALEVFSRLRVWDTEENCGVLIYVLLAERSVHIIADRGINKCVNQTEWGNIVRNMQHSFKQGQFQKGAIIGIEQITALLTTHFPATAKHDNQLPDAPVIIDDD